MDVDYLKTVVQKYELQNMHCAWVLSSGQYRLLLLDSLPVAAEELSSAMQWRIKEFINYPVEQAAIDYFQIPINDPRIKSTLYTVITNKIQLAETANAIRSSGLNLTTITIPEMCMRNLISLSAENQNGIGMLVIYADQCRLIITRNKEIYLVRNIDLPLTILMHIITDKPEDLSAEQRSALEALSLEIQRSFDYYLTQLHQTPVTKLLIDTEYIILLNFLKAQLTLLLNYLIYLKY